MIQRMIQQGEWFYQLNGGLSPDDFIAAFRQAIKDKVPEEFESSLYVWFETYNDPFTYEQRPGIRFQWERPMTEYELRVYEDGERVAQEERLKKAGVTPEMWAARRSLYERLKKEFDGV